MKVYVLHDYIEDSCDGFETNVINVSKNDKELWDQMKSEYDSSKERHEAFSKGETYIDDFSAAVVEEYGDYHFHHEWMIEDFEV